MYGEVLSGQATDSRGNSSVDGRKLTYDDATSYADVEFKDTNRTDGQWRELCGHRSCTSAPRRVRTSTVPPARTR
ncbi:hypothetical protein [Streptomyces sp. NRRL S-237]|uniref:hypothetical protein n=1 Tax=Streptomyces sp. NRRL S-237 TaxID=1463895 RepID=UPI0004C5FAB3|nr:hypothetical protein [Streptomyces sp. NRRL S-237]